MLQLGRFTKQFYISVPLYKTKSMSCKPSKLPVIAVIGASGVGKSKLGIELAVKLNGECINADAMQIYSGLDISTNKISESERATCPHHLLGMIDLIEKGDKYTVHNFQRDALPIVDGIIKRSKVPILVGGTMYYIEAVLFDHLVPERSADDGNYSRDDMTDKTNAELLSELQQVDPKTAFGMHPNDRRKIIRALEVWKKTGQPLSFYYEQQHATVSQNDNNQASCLSGKPRFEDSLMIWLDCDQKELDQRLDARVDEMVREGLLAELDEFFQRFKNKNPTILSDPLLKEESIHNGVLQSIGLKEFLPYLELAPDLRNAEKKLYETCLVAMKTKTKRYAKKQLTWIRNRFLKRRSNGVCPPVFRIDVTEFVAAANNSDKELQQRAWGRIMSNALAIGENSIARGCSMDALRSLKSSSGLEPEMIGVGALNDTIIRKQCTICRGNPVFVRESQWKQHIYGWRHLKVQKLLKAKSHSPESNSAVTCSVDTTIENLNK